MKTKGFSEERYIGDPINAVRLFNDLCADELIFLDICAGRERRAIALSFVRDVGSEANMPFAVGGGITTVHQIRDILAAGAEKVVLCTSAVSSPDFVAEASEMFGASTITVCMDVKPALLHGSRVCSDRGRRSSRYSPVDFARLMESCGAGELIVQSIHNDGVMHGYDLPLLRSVSEAVTIPVVALGGAGSLAHMRSAWREGCVSAVSAGSMFVFQGPRRGVLINYPTRSELRSMFNNGNHDCHVG